MLILSDRIKESSITTGSGSVILSGPFRGFQTFASGIGDSNSTYYTIENGKNFEIGIGTFDLSSNSLSRDFILESSNDDNLINLSDTSVVFCTYPASRSVFLDERGYVSGQLPHYSGIAFPDGTIQNTALDGTGLENRVAYWEDSNTLSSINNVSWNSSANYFSISGNLNVNNNVDIDGILSATGSLLTDAQLSEPLFYRSASGCFFHAYVDNANDNMIALYSSDEANPYWRLGIKSYTQDYVPQPTTGYVQGENGEVGIFATTQNYAVITSYNGFWVGHENLNIINAQVEEGVRIFNQDSTSSALTVIGAAAQAANLQEWQTYNSSVIASIDIDGQISIDTIRFGDGTVQSTAVLASTENYRTVTSNSYLSTNDGIVFVSCSGSTVELSLPSASGVGGTKITIKRKAGGGDNLVRILPSGSETLDSSSSHSMVYDNEAITLVSDNLNWFII